jgi:GNAT superfamily N-acetyltransferase
MKTMSDTYLVEDRLRDGRTVKIRAVRSEDKPILQEGMHHLSPRSLYFRFLTPKRELTEKELVYFTDIDLFHHVALLASVRENGIDIPAGVGRYVMSNNPALPLSADIAFAVSDEYQGLGIGTMLLRHLTPIARDAGILQFTALVLPDNRKMLHVFRHSGLPIKETVNCVGVLEVVLSLQ